MNNIRLNNLNNLISRLSKKSISIVDI